MKPNAMRRRGGGAGFAEVFVVDDHVGGQVVVLPELDPVKISIVKDFEVTHGDCVGTDRVGV